METPDTPESDATPRPPAPYMTYALVGINVALFIAMVLGGVDFLFPTPEEVYPWGANNRYGVLHDHEWWRLIAHMFEHYGILHIGVNMFALFQIGPVIELNFGRWRLLLFYLLAGVSGGAASILWSGDTVGEGASGAIFGLFGAFGAFATTTIIRPEARRPILRNLGIFLVINIGFGIESGIVDNAAHIGGLLGGALAAYASYFSMKKPDNMKPSAGGIALPVLAVGIMVALLLSFTPKAVKIEEVYQHYIEKVAFYEKSVVGFTNACDSLPCEEVLRQLHASKLADADKMILYADSIRQLNLNDWGKKDADLIHAITLLYKQRLLLVGTFCQPPGMDTATLGKKARQLNAGIDSLFKEREKLSKEAPKK